MGDARPTPGVCTDGLHPPLGSTGTASGEGTGWAGESGCGELQCKSLPDFTPLVPRRDIPAQNVRCHQMEVYKHPRPTWVVQWVEFYALGPTLKSPSISHSGQKDEPARRGAGERQIREWVGLLEKRPEGRKPRPNVNSLAALTGLPICPLGPGGFRFLPKSFSSIQPL